MAPKLSTALELVGIALLVAAGATVGVGLALAVAGVSLVLLGLAGER